MSFFYGSKTAIYIRKYGYRVGYQKLAWYQRDHERRYIRRAEQGNLTCQECHGEGQFLADIIAGHALYEPCGWCCECGYVVPWIRGYWLREKKRELREKSTTAILTGKGEARTALQKVS